MTESKPKPEEPLEGLRAAADAAGQALVAEAERARSGEGNGGGEGRGSGGGSRGGGRGGSGGGRQ